MTKDTSLEESGEQYLKYLDQLAKEQQDAITIHSQAAHLSLSKIKKFDILEIRALRRPPHPMQVMMYTLFNVLNQQISNWQDMRNALNSSSDLVVRLSTFEDGNISRSNMKRIEIDFIFNAICNAQTVGVFFNGSHVLYDWIHHQYIMAKYRHTIQGANIVFGYLRKHIDQNVPFGIKKLIHLYYESAANALECDVSSLPVLLPEADDITIRHSEPVHSDQAGNKSKRTKVKCKQG